MEWILIRREIEAGNCILPSPYLIPKCISIREDPSWKITETDPAGIMTNCHKRIFLSGMTPTLGLPLNEYTTRRNPFEFAFRLLRSWKGETMPHCTERCRGISVEMWHRQWTAHRFRPEDSSTTTSAPWCRTIYSPLPLEIRVAIVSKSVHHHLWTHQFIESTSWCQCRCPSNRMSTL